MQNWLRDNGSPDSEVDFPPRWNKNSGQEPTPHEGIAEPQNKSMSTLPKRIQINVPSVGRDKAESLADTGAYNPEPVMGYDRPNREALVAGIEDPRLDVGLRRPTRKTRVSGNGDPVSVVGKPTGENFAVGIGDPAGDTGFRRPSDMEISPKIVYRSSANFEMRPVVISEDEYRMPENSRTYARIGRDNRPERVQGSQYRDDIELNPRPPVRSCETIGNPRRYDDGDIRRSRSEGARPIIQTARAPPGFERENMSFAPDVNNRRKPNRPLISPEMYTGETSWTDYKAHFESVSELNEWDIETRGRFLATCLRGPAQRILSNLPSGWRSNYHELVKQLATRFGPREGVELYKAQLKSLRRKPNQVLGDLADQVRRLSNLAYPCMDYVNLESMGVSHFYDALDDLEMRLRVFQSKPSTLDDALTCALELETFRCMEAERSGTRPIRRNVNAVSGNDPQIDTVDRIRKLESELRNLSVELENYRKGPMCFNCKAAGHMRDRCPELHPICRQCGTTHDSRSLCKRSYTQNSGNDGRPR